MNFLTFLRVVSLLLHEGTKMAIRNISICSDPSDNALLFLFTNFSSELWRPQHNRRFGTQR